MTRTLLTNCTDTLSLCLGLTPATEGWDGRPSQISQTRHPPHPHARSVGFASGATSCTNQRSELATNPLWAIPEARRGRGLTPVACRPANPASQPVGLHAKQQKATLAANYFDLGFVVGMPGGGVHGHRIVSHPQSITSLSPESGSAPSNWPRSRPRGLRTHDTTL